MIGLWDYISIQKPAEADVICCATSSTTPVFNDHNLKPGVHINGVGSYPPEMQEISPETVQRAALIVDSRQAVTRCLTGSLPSGPVAPH